MSLIAHKLEQTNVVDDNKPNKCDTCGKDTFIVDGMTGEVVCIYCGVVQSTPIVSLEPESHGYTLKQRSNRIRTKPLTPTHADYGLSTTIPYSGRDHSGKQLDAETIQTMRRLRRHHNRARLATAEDRNFTVASNHITKLVDALNLPTGVHELSSTIYRKALAQDLIRGREIRTIAGACVYAACRQTQTMRSLVDVVAVLKCTKKDLSRSYKLVVRELKIKMPTPRIKPYIGKYVRALSLSGEVELRAIEIADACIAKHVSSGKDPSGFAASILYIVCREMDIPMTQKILAKLAGTTEVTLRTRYKEINLELGLDLKPLGKWARNTGMTLRRPSTDHGEEDLNEDPLDYEPSESI